MGLEKLLGSKIIKNIFIAILVLIVAPLLLIILLILLTSILFPQAPGSIEIQEEDLFCNSDADCTSTFTLCSQCECGSPVNVQNKNKYIDLYKSTCENYSGPICEMLCEPTRNICINNKCST